MGQTGANPGGEKERLLRAAEEKQRSVSGAIEAALSIGDLAKETDNPITVREFIEITAERINEIIAFDVCGFFVVDQVSADVEPLWCSAEQTPGGLDSQMEYLIERGYIGWAMHEPRGLVVYSGDQRCRVLIHPIATYARIRGVFIGLYPALGQRWPHGARQAVSLILRNMAGALESVEYHELCQRRNAEMDTTIARRVDELHQHDRQLENARKMDAIGALAGGVAHQFNNALMVLTGNLELIKLGCSGMPDFDKCMERIEATAQRMQDLTAKLLAYARGGKYVTQSITIQALFKEVLARFKPAVNSAVKLDFRLPAEPCCVQVDLTQMHLALSAIVTNAIEALGKAGLIRIGAEKITIAAGQSNFPVDLAPGRYVAIHVSDTGHGIPENIKDRIFEPFFTTKFTGRGLSMAAVYGIVQNHHGAVAVDSKVGEGTTVHLYLPLVEPPQ